MKWNIKPLIMIVMIEMANAGHLKNKKIFRNSIQEAILIQIHNFHEIVFSATVN